MSGLDWFEPEQAGRSWSVIGDRQAMTSALRVAAAAQRNAGLRVA
jgi:hypothetical protein